MNNLDFARVAITARLREQSDANVRDDAADLARLQAAADQHLRDNLPRPESATERDAMLDAGVVEVSDNDIINVVMWEFDWSYDEATKNMKAIDYAAAWAERLELAEQAE